MNIKQINVDDKSYTIPAGGGATYTAGEGIAISDDNVISNSDHSTLANKVDKVEGKVLSTNDYTTDEKTKLAGLSNYDDTAVKTSIAAKQDKLTAGTNITIENNVISSTGGGSVEIDTTLAVSGAAADAKVVGDKLASATKELVVYPEQALGVYNDIATNIVSGESGTEAVGGSQWLNIISASAVATPIDWTAFGSLTVKWLAGRSDRVYLTGAVRVYAGDIITYASKGASNARGWELFDDAGNPLSYADASVDAMSNPVEIPVTADGMLIIHWYFSTGYLSNIDAIDAACGYVKVTRTRGGSAPVAFADNTELMDYWKEVVRTTTTEDTNPRINNWYPQHGDTFKVLDIGNSFTQDATRHVGEICNSVLTTDQLAKLCLVTAIRSSSTWKTWYDALRDQDNYAYSLSRQAGTLDPYDDFSSDMKSYEALDGSGIRKLLTATNWDLIVVHELSTYAQKSTLWEGTTAGGYLREFVQEVRKYQPATPIAFLSPEISPKQFSDTSDGMTNNVAAMKFMRDKYGVDLIIPASTSLENVRSSEIASGAKHSLTRDGHHCGYGVGDYTQSLAYYQAIFAPFTRVSMMGDASDITFTAPTGYESDCIAITDDNRYLCKLAALAAVSRMDTIVNPDNLDVYGIDLTKTVTLDDFWGMNGDFVSNYSTDTANSYTGNTLANRGIVVGTSVYDIANYVADTYTSADDGGRVGTAFHCYPGDVVTIANKGGETGRAFSYVDSDGVLQYVSGDSTTSYVTNPETITIEKEGVAFINIWVDKNIEADLSTYKSSGGYVKIERTGKKIELYATPEDVSKDWATA